MTTRNIDYGVYVRRGFGLGVALFVLGALGAVVAPVFVGPLPDWLSTAFTDVEAVGLVVAFASVFVFGMILPLTE
ncbi:MAG: hypothetical protein ACOCT0_03025 [Halobacteriota archaeon]